MALIKPFRALRPRPEQAKHVSCVPYDIVSESEVRALVEDNSLSFLRVTRPEAEFDAADNVSTESALNRARQNLQKLIDDGILALESEPCLYIYRLVSGAHTQTGIVACCSIDEYESGLIKKHEKTRPDKVEDRTNHMLALNAQTGLIFLAYRGTEKIRGLIDEAALLEPLYDFVCPYGVRQTVWRISRTSELVNAFSEVPALYIADGHHRAESALRARVALRAKNPGHTGGEDYNFVMAGVFPAEDLHILAYNRVVKDLNGMTGEDFFNCLRESFDVAETLSRSPESRGEFRMYFEGTWYRLELTTNTQMAEDAIENLDVSILQHYILAPVLGIGDPRTDDRIGFVGGARGTEELQRLVDEGNAKVAFSLFPTTMNDLFTVSDMGEIMPPKSTWFEPKLKDGLFVHKI